MATAGLQVINSVGTFLVSDRNPTLAFVQKGTITLSTYVPGAGGIGSHYMATAPLPSGRECVVLAFTSTAHVYQYYMAGDAVFRSPTAGAQVTWYMFARPVAPSASGAGLQVFDAAGKCTFDSEQRPGVVVDAIAPLRPDNSFIPSTFYVGPNFPAGKQYAVIPYAVNGRVAQATVPGVARGIVTTVLCSNHIELGEFITDSGGSDADENEWGLPNGMLLVDVTGY